MRTHISTIIVQICITGTAQKPGDYDAVLQLAVADDRVTRFIAITRCGVGELEATDACQTRAAIIAQFLPSVAGTGDKADFSRPFQVVTANKETLRLWRWLGAQVATSLYGTQDYAAPVKVR
jgi:hypothetical protein